MEIRKNVAPEFVLGSGALDLAGRYASNFAAQRALVVTDPGVIAAGWTGQVVAALERSGVASSIFAEVSPNPREAQVMRGAAFFAKVGADVIVAVGGGTQGRLWLQIVSDATGLVQEVPSTTIGAGYGAAFLAASAVAPAGAAPRIEDWNPVVDRIEPDPTTRAAYDDLFDRYLRLYAGTQHVVHELAAAQKDAAQNDAQQEAAA